MKRAIALVSGVLVLASAGSSIAAGDPTAGKAKFDLFCTACHGAAGKGDGVAGAALNPKPRDLTDAAWQKATPDATVAKVIKEGGASIGKSPMMTAWGASLTDPEIDNVVAYIRQLGGKK